VHNAPYSTVDIPEVMTRNSAARDTVAGFAAAMPALSAMWQHIQTALADAGDLAAEVARLSAAVAAARLDRANALAAMRATIAAQCDGETDPLSYLRDELQAAQSGSAAHTGGNRG
jgi:CelD/BcsL family acetyltransferase involved in cellulose biosynthesis